MRKPDPPTAETTLRMVRQRRRDTRPELALRSALHARGLRYWVDRPILEGGRRKADLVFPRRRVAVFVDGCFWHRCPIHGSRPKRNAEWWDEKLQANVNRDRDTDRELEANGWVVVRVWEHESTESATRKVLDALA